MQGLMLKLHDVDAAGERALRVVSYFDQLLANQPELESVVRATAILADCTAGLRVPGGADALRFTQDGDALSTAAGDPSTTIALRPPTGPGPEGLVWLERRSGDDALDEFILERMALAASSVLQRRGASRLVDQAFGFSDPALASLLVNENANEADRSRAARLMGLDLSDHIQCIAIRLDRPDDGVVKLAESLRAAWTRPVQVSQMTSELALAVVASMGELDWSLVEGVGNACNGPSVRVIDAPISWARAREGVRFAGLGASWPPHIRSEWLGSLPMFLDFDAKRVLANPDVQAIQRLSESSSGSESIQILDLYLHAESMRSAARDANFHHSSVQARLQRIERQIDIDLRDGFGRQRAATALLLWQLHRSA